MPYSTLDDARIYDMEGSGYFQFQFKPSSMEDSKSVVWAEYPILGRSVPLIGYNYSAPRRISFTAVLFANPTEQDSGTPPSLIKRQGDFMQAMTYSDYRGGLKPPHKLFFTFGTAVQMIGVAESVRIGFPEKFPWDLGPGFIHGLEISCQIREVSDDPVDTWGRRVGGF